LLSRGPCYRWRPFNQAWVKKADPEIPSTAAQTADDPETDKALAEFSKALDEWTVTGEIAQGSTLALRQVLRHFPVGIFSTQPVILKRARSPMSA
jgi:hypothetical protein